MEAIRAIKYNQLRSEDCIEAFSPEDFALLPGADQEVVKYIIRGTCEDRSDLEEQDCLLVSRALASDDFLLPSLAKVKAYPKALRKEELLIKYKQFSGLV